MFCVKSHIALAPYYTSNVKYVVDSWSHVGLESFASVTSLVVKWIKWSAVRYTVDVPSWCENFGGYDSKRSRDLSDGLPQHVHAVAGLWLDQLPVRKHHMSTRHTCRPVVSRFCRPRWRCSVAVVEPNLCCNSLEKQHDVFQLNVERVLCYVWTPTILYTSSFFISWRYLILNGCSLKVLLGVRVGLTNNRDSRFLLRLWTVW